MKKFYMSLVNHRKTMVMIFTMVFVVCLLLGNLVKVNYDINDYLPESSPSTVSLELMQEEFDGGIPNARIMISDVTIPEALEYKEKLEANAEARKKAKEEAKARKAAKEGTKKLQTKAKK